MTAIDSPAEQSSGESHWTIWRPIVTPGCTVTLKELETFYSLDDLLDCHEALDRREEMMADLVGDLMESIGTVAPPS